MPMKRAEGLRRERDNSERKRGLGSEKKRRTLPKLWTKAGCLCESIANLDPRRLASVQKDLVALLLYGGVETSLPLQSQVWGSDTLFILLRKVASREIDWDPEIMDHLAYALTISGQFEF
ncbi:hypothetical protein PVL29_005238 [Vitis rotundifolia]|uniref:Uncharacterized protein n=1 Tax=Vitis rotundifolia TaxID=103349 RepID=A0AA39ACH4_VITRO|nr:hypothetical protein PVL29_005238 [Vitis rotundifolia]